MELFTPTGGYRRLDLFTLATLVQLETWRFCHRFLSRENDPKGRLFDQMTQAARSGRANLMEGAERGATSRETELKLIDVARASLAELLGDYEMWLLFHNQVPWKFEQEEPVWQRRLDPANFGRDLLHDSGTYVLEQRKKFAEWLDVDDSCIVANALCVLIHRTMLMIQRHLEKQGEKFKAEGGFREKLTAVRLEARDIPQPTDNAPACPECGKAMRQRQSSKDNRSFWGCTSFPACKGTRPISG